MAKRDPKNGSKLVVLPLLDGTTKELPRLRPSFIFRLKNRIHAERREQILRNARDTTSIDSVTTQDKLDEHDARQVDRDTIVRWAMTPDGLLPTLGMAWVQTKLTPGAVYDEKTFETMLAEASGEVDKWEADYRDFVRAAAGVLNVPLGPKSPIVPPSPEERRQMMQELIGGIAELLGVENPIGASAGLRRSDATANQSQTETTSETQPESPSSTT